MQATDILMDEHKVILRVIGALETAAQRVEAGQAMRPEFFLDAAAFIKGFADGCHHRKEEGVLFKEMVAAGLPGESGPIGVMLSEHELGRAYTRALREAALKLQAGDQDARPALVHAAGSYAALLRQHLGKEDGVLYPMAGRVLSPEVQARLTNDFEKVEHEETGAGVHEKYLALAEKMISEVS